jgi:hypothetical protein
MSASVILDRSTDLDIVFTAEPHAVLTTVTCSTPLELLRHVFQISDINASLKYEATSAVDFLREYLLTRERRGLEYIFGNALFTACLTPAPGGESLHEALTRKFRELDRRRNDVAVPMKSLPLHARDAQIRRFILSQTHRVNIIRSFHIAEALDSDGPWSQSPEKDEMLGLIMRLLTGYRPAIAVN